MNAGGILNAVNLMLTPGLEEGLVGTAEATGGHEQCENRPRGYQQS